MVNIRTPWAFQDLVHELDLMTRDAGWPFESSCPASNENTTGLTVGEDTATLELDLPGVQDENLSIELEDGHLTIQASREDLHGSEEQVVLRERSFGEFLRKYTLPWPVDEKKVEARFENGVLTVRFPRAAEAAPRRIEINNA